MKKTKVICTMGPNTNDRELIKQLALSRYGYCKI